MGKKRSYRRQYFLFFTTDLFSTSLACFQSYHADTVQSHVTAETLRCWQPQEPLLSKHVGSRHFLQRATYTTTIMTLWNIKLSICKCLDMGTRSITLSLNDKDHNQQRACLRHHFALMENTDTTSLLLLSKHRFPLSHQTKRVLCVELPRCQRQYDVEALPVCTLPDLCEAVFYLQDRAGLGSVFFLR